MNKNIKNKNFTNEPPIDSVTAQNNIILAQKILALAKSLIEEEGYPREKKPVTAVDYTPPPEAPRTELRKKSSIIAPDTSQELSKENKKKYEALKADMKAAEDYLIHTDNTNAYKGWSENKDILLIMQTESQMNPNAQNPGSSAWGLFQSTKGNWQESLKKELNKPKLKNLPQLQHKNFVNKHGKDGSIFWQTVAAFRYILRYYKTPQQAWTFHQATRDHKNIQITMAPSYYEEVQKIPEGLPRNLEERLEKWRKKRLKGY